MRSTAPTKGTTPRLKSFRAFIIIVKLIEMYEKMMMYPIVEDRSFLILSPSPQNVLRVPKVPKGLLRRAIGLGLARVGSVIGGVWFAVARSLRGEAESLLKSFELLEKFDMDSSEES
eukprot:GHVP01066128.1.p2 GENE.GHVP01066128.1~~GHVP01066128.1.p2  ORF type:complete len:117 (-),score=3.06 GHVP01066128.1:49-399(-)